MNHLLQSIPYCACYSCLINISATNPLPFSQSLPQINSEQTATQNRTEIANWNNKPCPCHCNKQSIADQKVAYIYLSIYIGPAGKAWTKPKAKKANNAKPDAKPCSQMVDSFLALSPIPLLDPLLLSRDLFLSFSFPLSFFLMISPPTMDSCACMCMFDRERALVFIDLWPVDTSYKAIHRHAKTLAPLNLLLHWTPLSFSIATVVLLVCSPCYLFRFSKRQI